MLEIHEKTKEIIDYLELEKVPENGGWFKLIHHDVPAQHDDCPDSCKQANSTTILRLVEHETATPWHRIGATTIWSFLDGDPLMLSLYCDDGVAKTQILGNMIGSVHQPLVLIPGNCWRQFRCMGEWTLSSCICTPGFEFEQLELAENGWVPDELFRH